MSRQSVDLVLKVFPQPQVAVISSYFGWIPDFMFAGNEYDVIKYAFYPKKRVNLLVTPLSMILIHTKYCALVIKLLLCIIIRNAHTRRDHFGDSY